MTAITVLGDSVPRGHRTDATAWPRRLADAADGDATVAVRGHVGTSLAALADDPPTAAGDNADRRLVLVHAGHNDAQLSDGDPRVPLARFRAAATSLDRTLAAADGVDRHAFVGLIPLLDVGAVPFADVQPDRALRYDAALSDAVDTHLPVAEPVGAWRERTVDGVHPDGDGHAHLARRVADRLLADG